MPAEPARARPIGRRAFLLGVVTVAGGCGGTAMPRSGRRSQPASPPGATAPGATAPTTTGPGATATAVGPGATATAVGPASAAFTAPAVIDSVNGRLDLTLVVAATMVPSGTGERWALTYNGTTPGPTLRLRPGDRLQVRLVNRLDKATNLHLHGLHVDPGGAADNPFVMVGPGEEHRYDVLLPADHRSGLFWYHPHHHGLVAEQVAAGLAGAIVVLDAVDDDPAVASTVERVLVLGDPRVGSSAAVVEVAPREQMQGRVGDGLLVNGVGRPSAAARVGAVERWRLVNATASRRLHLRLNGASWWQMASDGGRLAAPMALGALALAPGERAEVLVPLTAAGAVALVAETAPTEMGAGMGGGMMGGSGAATATEALLELVVSGAAGAAAPALPAALAEVEDVRALEVRRSRTLAFAMGMGMGGGAGRTFTIDGRTFDGARVDNRAELDTVEDWTITNASPMAHPFHLHTWPFQVLERSDGAPAAGWKDVVDVPSGGSVRIRIPFRRYAGRTVYHCHILDHEDLGMMGVIEVS